MKKQIIILAAALSLGLGSANAEEVDTKGWQIGGIRIANPFDSTTWWDGGEHSQDEIITFDFANPEFWMSIPDPKKHS
jgi:hypothetical protein